MQMLFPVTWCNGSTIGCGCGCGSINAAQLVSLWGSQAAHSSNPKNQQSDSDSEDNTPAETRWPRSRLAPMTWQWQAKWQWQAPRLHKPQNSNQNGTGKCIVGRSGQWTCGESWSQKSATQKYHKNTVDDDEFRLRYEHTFKENLPDSSQPHGHTATLSATVSHAIQFILFYSDSILFYSILILILFNSILFYFYSILVYSVYSIIIYICWSLALNKHETEVNRLKFRWVI